MTLANQYSIAVRHQRSTRIDSDLSETFFPGLVYHGTAQTTLETLVRQYSQSGQSAYTLTGPYGSGKSTIALLLSGVLSFDANIRDAASRVINSDSKALIEKSLPINNGWLQIRSVGGVNAPVETFWGATLSALEEHPNTRALFNKYNSHSPKDEAQLVATWEALFIEAKEHVDGVLILADEMGKTLEFINKNKGELHLFQDLAEVLSRINTPVIFLGLLHQSFSEYAKERGTKLQEEWAKIQGRYTDILYNVSTDETVALIAQSIEPKDKSQKDNTPYIEMVLNAIEDSDNRKKQLHSRLRATAPLHPLVSLILGPLSKRRFSQNERSTFSFLNSHEQHSFQLFLQNTIDRDARYALDNLWDYLETNLEHAILGSPDGHAWAEASEAINRIDVSDITLSLLKSIALINLFGKQAKLYATEQLLKAASGIENIAVLKEHLRILQDASTIIYRKHQSAWVIFEGSDLDIPHLLEEKIEQLENSHEAMEHLAYSQQVMAKGHYHMTGSLRWVEQTLKQSLAHVDSEGLNVPQGGEFAHFVLLMEEADSATLKQLTDKCPTMALAVAKNAVDITTYAKEVYALELLKSDKEIGGAIQHDKVAQKEYDSRYSDAQKMLWAAIEEGFSSSLWTIRGQAYSEAYPLSELASELADHIFPDSPRILNELVNRNKISGTAVSARKKLLEAMLDFDDEENLGINGFPPEKSMYISCLMNTNIHQVNSDEWGWSLENVAPEFKKLFSETTAFLQNNAGEKINLATIESMWSRAPYGISIGVFPILLFAYLKTLGQDIAYYEKAISGDFEFLSEPDVDYVHKLQKSPKELAIKFIVLNSNDSAWIKLLQPYVGTLTTQSVNLNLLSVATPLVTTMHALPYWVQNASNLVPNNLAKNKKVLRLRDAFLQANDPHDLLINQLCDIVDPEGKLSQTQRIDSIEECVNILKSAHEKMLGEMNEKIKQFFPETDDDLLAMCEAVENKAGDLRLKSFARELGRSQNFGLKWLESIISVVVGRGMQNWNESNLLTAKQKVSDFSQDFLRIVKASQNTATSEPAVKTQNISLVLEGDKGLVNYTKEIKLSDPMITEPAISSIKERLAPLSEFEKIDVLQQLLKEALKAQG